MSALKTVTAYTDGSCLGNPGPGGWAALLRYSGHSRELSGAFAMTTNNRMEILAAIMALEALREQCAVALYTDSTYLRDAVEKDWLGKWQKNGWKTAANKAVRNQDLWQRLARQLARHSIHFAWVAGHAGNVENERVDALARTAAGSLALQPDPGFIERHHV